MRDDIQYILSGKSQVKHHHLIQAACSYLKGSQGTSSMVKDQQLYKEEETKRLVQFIEEKDLWVDNINIELKSDLNIAKAFLENNGFINKKNHDYYNKELGLILEDLHDENVLTQNGMLYFIDTVFYIINPN